jgi:hypothetical protein
MVEVMEIIKLWHFQYCYTEVKHTLLQAVPRDGIKNKDIGRVTHSTSVNPVAYFDDYWTSYRFNNARHSTAVTVKFIG